MYEEFYKACRLGDLESIENIIKSNPEALQNLDPNLG